MRTAELEYALPDELIARYPLERRDASRLLVVGDELHHATVEDWPELLEPGSVVVLNDSRVIKARLLGARRETGGRVEIFLLRPAGGSSGIESTQWEALGRANRPLREGTVVQVGELEVRVVERRDDGTLLVELVASTSIASALHAVGQVPIPPYLGRDEEPEDELRYQTVFAREPGSVAAPTAGLHLTEALLSRLGARNIVIGRLTLHVGMGTFRPVATEQVEDHPMHIEGFSIGEALVDAIVEARRTGAQVVAVGTTVVRALESAALMDGSGLVRAGAAETRLLIQPGYQFRIVDGLLTNFHQPRSTLLALVGAFAGMDRIREAYRVAVEQRYRFLSYGDAMWIPKRA